MSDEIDPAVQTEAKARQMGWVPLEKFKGDPAKWRPAEDYIARGEEVLPILKHNNRQLLDKLTGLEATVESLKAAKAEADESMEALRKYHEETAQREYDRAMRDLKAAKIDAIREGDHERAAQLEGQIDTLKEPAKLPEPKRTTQTTTPQENPVVTQWLADNAEMMADKEKKAYAMGMVSYLRAMGDTRQDRAFLDEVSDMVKQKYAEPAPRQKVEGGGTRPRSGVKTYADLPADAKAACDKMSAKLVGENRAFKTQEEWRKSYTEHYDWS